MKATDIFWVIALLVLAEILFTGGLVGIFQFLEKVVSYVLVGGLAMVSLCIVVALITAMFNDRQTDNPSDVFA